MIDEKRLIKKLDNRIDTFIKQHPEEKDCLAVQSVRKFKQMLEAEAKENEWISCDKKMPDIGVYGLMRKIELFLE